MSIFGIISDKSCSTAKDKANFVDIIQAVHLDLLKIKDWDN